MLLVIKNKKGYYRIKTMQKLLPKRRAAIKIVSIVFLFHLQIIDAKAQNSIPPIGYWREHLNYQNTIQVVKGDKIYCATANNVFSVDTNNEVERYSKVSGLNDLGVSCIAWDDLSRQLVIVYNNSNLDLLKGDNVNNIGDIKRSSIVGNKTIYNIFCSGGLAYLSSGLGIIVADLAKLEIKDTWMIGANGNQVKVNGFTSDGTYFYAATDEGVRRAAINANNLANYNNWVSMGVGNGLSAGAANNVLFTSNKLVVQKNDSLFILNNNMFNFLYASSPLSIANTSVSENTILVCQLSATASKVVQLNVNGGILKTLAQPGIISSPKNALSDNGTVWIADYYGGLSNISNTVQRYIPNGPLGAASGEMVFNNDTLYAAAGSVDAAWNYTYNRNGIYIFNNDNWNDEGYYNRPALNNVLDFITVAVDPINQTLWAGSYGGGLVNFSGNNTTIYNKTNSTLQAAIGDTASCRISGLAFDQNNNLWISNYAASQDLQVRKADGTFKSFSIPFAHFENALSQLVVDDANQLWMVSPRGNGVFCYNYGNSIDVLNDDQWKYFRTGIGNGNLPSNNVYCIAKDKDGFIWVGTDAGIAVVQCASTIFEQNCDAIWPIVQQDAFAGYLFQNETVQCIAVDGANRKWVGTRNGVWLVSADGSQILYNFTQSNSPLLNNDVEKISIDPKTGEVFMATFTGICSFRSTATEGGETNAKVLVFPNPVPPNYAGTIAIRGLVDHALVKIAELNGRLVFQTRALGGQAVWNGENYNGQKVATGVYLVIIRNDDGTEKAVTKIVLVNGK